VTAALTAHSIHRGAERLNLNAESLQRAADKALEVGFQHWQATGPLRRYCDKLYLSHRTANNLRIHGNTVFLFSDEVLLTVHSVPGQLRHIVDKLRARLDAITE
jgi:hypothetical protein